MILRPLAALLLAVVLSACVDQSIKSTSVPSVNAASAQVSEELLLDVSIVVFDPGLDDYDEDQQVYPEVRKAEARYMPGLLSQAIQDSGAWGAVRVVPSNEQFTDLMVQGKILYSDGEELQLQINATDSRGYVWLDKKYTGNSSHYAYKVTTRSTYDPFQAVYNTIANDLLQSLEELRPKDRENVRLITELLFARSFSQDAFDGYLAQDRKGRYMVMRLPAENDPMLERVQAIRERDRVFVDTLQEYYVNFDAQMTDPYQEWRRLSYEESMALQELKAESTRRLIAGTVAILAGIAGASSGDSAMTRTAGQVAIVGGGFLLKSGLEKRSEAQIHVEALEELGMSLEAEIAPQVIELEDRTVMLSGNVEDQYSQWREVLADIYRTEIGELELPENSA
ncbi:MAG: hypothetical protein DRR04_06145, partial [Gammaproteobacteria bacterium]